jgi:hypothetical protein
MTRQGDVHDSGGAEPHELGGGLPAISHRLRDFLVPINQGEVTMAGFLWGRREAVMLIRRCVCTTSP